MNVEDDLGITYLVENAQQFWSELEDVLNLPKEPPTLSLLDLTLRRYTAFCAAYHELYLQSPLQLEHACNLIAESELFSFHSERMCEMLGEELRSNTDPHSQLIMYHIMLCHGRRRSDFFRSSKRWTPLLPLLMDHILVEIDPEEEDAYFGNSGSSSSHHGSTSVPIPIEAKLRSLCIRLVYEVCRVQKFSTHDLKIFDDKFLDYLFDLVEQTRNMQDEVFNYSCIKLIVALNEQFMVASLPSESEKHHSDKHPSSSEPANRVLRILMRRLGSSKTFGENMIFMLNRAEHTPEDLCMQLLVLKLLYLLFTTKGTSEYFYTNDLCVLVDVFLRELTDLDDDSESVPPAHLSTCSSSAFDKNAAPRNPVQAAANRAGLGRADFECRCAGYQSDHETACGAMLKWDWCVHLRKSPPAEEARRGSSEASAPQSHLHTPSPLDLQGRRSLRSSKSVEFLPGAAAGQPASRSSTDAPRRPSNASSVNLVASAVLPAPVRKGSAHSGIVDGSHANRHRAPSTHDPSASSMTVPSSIATSFSGSSLPSSPVHLQVHVTQPTPHRRTPPPPPTPKRRKPPAIPVGKGTTVTTIRSSSMTASPLSKTTF
ncbi:unnamed protein product [Mycena citricolor]|uniref:SPIN90/Ldb17 leucine-rich domain-containing protein n=1 Tax=Mycena citricolor TaxID=2018698 RepID=A0AAD2K4Z8_9AGAR|nr:unnamed protein product [Mycena citricolor]